MALVNAGQYVYGQQSILPVRLVSVTTGEPLTGVTNADLQLSYANIDGSTAATTFSVFESDWLELHDGIMPGLYSLRLPNFLVSGPGKLVIRVKTNTSEAYEALLEVVGADNDLVVQAIQTMESNISRIAGLCLENAVQDQETYDDWGNLTSARLRIYVDRSSAENADGVEPSTPIETYHFNAGFSGPNICTGFAMLRGEPPL